MANNRQRVHVPEREYASKITPRGKGGYEWSETAMPDIVDAADRYVHVHACGFICRKQSVQARLTFEGKERQHRFETAMPSIMDVGLKYVCLPVCMHS